MSEDWFIVVHRLYLVTYAIVSIYTCAQVYLHCSANEHVKKNVIGFGVSMEFLCVNNGDWSCHSSPLVILHFFCVSFLFLFFKQKNERIWGDRHMGLFVWVNTQVCKCVNLWRDSQTVLLTLRFAWVTAMVSHSHGWVQVHKCTGSAPCCATEIMGFRGQCLKGPSDNEHSRQVDQWQSLRLVVTFSGQVHVRLHRTHGDDLMQNYKLVFRCQLTWISCANYHNILFLNFVYKQMLSMLNCSIRTRSDISEWHQAYFKLQLWTEVKLTKQKTKC